MLKNSNFNFYDPLSQTATAVGPFRKKQTNKQLGLTEKEQRRNKE